MNAQLRPITAITEESYSDALIAEMSPLLYAQWKEIATFKDVIPLDPDFDAYKRLGSKIVCMTARQNGVLIGYCVSLLRYSTHYQSTLASLNDVIYVDPAYRKGSLGLRLIRATEKRLRELNVVKVVWHAKPRTQLAQLLVKLGYVVDELMLAKVN